LWQFCDGAGVKVNTSPSCLTTSAGTRPSSTATARTVSGSATATGVSTEVSPTATGKIGEGSTATESPIPAPSSSGLSPGSIAGIAVGAIVGMAIILLGLLIAVRKRRAKKNASPPSMLELEDAPPQSKVAELPSPDVDSPPGKKPELQTPMHPDIAELDPNPPQRGPQELPSSATPPTNVAELPLSPAKGSDEAPRELDVQPQPTPEQETNRDGEPRLAIAEDEEWANLEQRQAQLAERKRRLMEIERIEAEEAEIAQRMSLLRKSD